ncbi:GNAT family N-acetyltransferase [Paenibacillus spiritus]|uniref:GNAT family N-acetyltransferase n=1 Tax=Paenibacillus spiritus TaxID=2496557 RepID=A0A5J5GIK0_9BACL|nr:GNAT family N-acetyltransferase [Paenibacillus spiritus]KAA9007543.1 GNAT family N-acetyltransferase [Paenibacillus spiritus]
MERTLRLEPVPPEHPDLSRLIARLDVYLSGLYPPEEIFAVDFQNPSVQRMFFLVAYLGNEPVGCGAFKRLDDGCGELKRFYVEPGHRNQGIARALLERLEQAALGSGCSVMRLETGEPQAEAVGFYRKHGYLPIDRYGEYVDCPSSLCMEKLLAASKAARRAEAAEDRQAGA